jgi:hypothetical protein
MEIMILPRETPETQKPSLAGIGRVLSGHGEIPVRVSAPMSVVYPMEHQ